MKGGILMNDQEIIRQVRSKNDIVDFIGEYIPLVQKGKNYFCVCPFHDDTNPSMSISREKQIYTCFSCGATGNIFTFLMEYEHISFREALSILAKRQGIELKGASFSKNTTNAKYDSLYELYRLSNKYYQNNINTNLGKKAKSYLANRKINDEIIKEFEIGLSLIDKSPLTTLLTNKGYKLDLLNKIGLSSGNQDAFIDRIMFPLYDINGKVVGFSGRIYENSNLNKYLNTKETPIFKKGQTLYHYHIAKEVARKDKFVIVMEGFMDVIRASTIGIKNTVALMGTALTNEQAQLLKRLSSNIILCFDGDSAGKKATLAVGNHLEEIGIHPKVIILEDNNDPDEFILKYGRERFIGLVEHAIHFSDYKIKVLKEGINFKSDEEVSNYIHGVLKEVSLINDAIRVEIILKNLAKECNIGYNTLEKRLRELKDGKNNLNTTSRKIVAMKSSTIKKLDKFEKANHAILYYMLMDDKVLYQYDKESLLLKDEKCRYLASEISYYYKKYGIVNIADFYTYLSGREDLIGLLNEILKEEYPDEVSSDTICDYFNVIKEYNKSQEVKRLKELMEKEIDPLEQAKIADQIRVLKIGS